jgi:hypothetical protein
MEPAAKGDRDLLLVAASAAVVSVISFLSYFHRGDLLLYGDAVAHINIARRVFDSRTPGLLQLGTVWLPLPHLLMLPFLYPEELWRSGAGGSMPSMIAYVAAAIGVFRLLRDAHCATGSSPAARIASGLGTAIFALNPNLIYLQATAMTEPLYLALFVWSIAFFARFAGAVQHRDTARASAALRKCGLCTAGMCLTRYDGWFLSAVLSGLVMLHVFRIYHDLSSTELGELRRGVTKFLIGAVGVPVLWLAYNGIVYRNPLEFATGPYSAKAIERRTATPGNQGHPGTGSVRVSTLYFLKSAQHNLGEGRCQKIWLGLALCGSFLATIRWRSWWPLLLLWMPVPFYALSIAYGGVPIFIPSWWPFTHYNVRYGLQLLPAFSIFCGLFLGWMMGRGKHGRWIGLSTAALFVAASYYSVWRATPVSFREAWINSRTRLNLEDRLAEELQRFPPTSTYLMYLGDHVGALQQAGIPLRQTINEGNHRPWRRPSDPEGLWERALADPATAVDYAIGIDRDAVSQAAEAHQLPVLTTVEVPGQPRATIYRARGGGGSSHP